MPPAPRPADRKWKAVLAYLLAIPLVLDPVPPPATAQSNAIEAPAAPAADLSRPELEQLLAPIALYPDDLLVQVLVASTYPLELVLAARWIEAPGHKRLKGDALLKALDGENWDPSVKSLVPFPEVLKTMSDQLDWTQNLGDAFLAQQSDVFAAVQALRSRASQAGSLKSTPQQTVVQEMSAITIQPAQPDTVYVPAYDPNVAYGAWPYPSYPPPYYPPPAGYYLGPALATGLAFGAGIAITGALWGWGSANWGGGNVNVNVNRFNQINANRQTNLAARSQAGVSQRWQHNAAHRRGVAYPNNALRQQYRGGAGANAAGREAFRGRTGNAAGGLPALRPAGGAGRPAGLPQGPRSDVARGTPGAGAGAGGLKQRAQGERSRPGGSTANLQNRPRAAQLPSAGRAPGAGQRAGQAGISRPSAGARTNFSGGMQRSPQRSSFQRPSHGGAAFQGVGNARATRAASAQGFASRGGGARGGGARAGGGGGFRGGGGRR